MHGHDELYQEMCAYSLRVCKIYKKNHASINRQMRIVNRNPGKKISRMLRPSEAEIKIKMQRIKAMGSSRHLLRTLGLDHVEEGGDVDDPTTEKHVLEGLIHHNGDDTSFRRRRKKSEIYDNLEERFQKSTRQRRKGRRQTLMKDDSVHAALKGKNPVAAASAPAIVSQSVDAGPLFRKKSSTTSQTEVHHRVRSAHQSRAKVHPLTPAAAARDAVQKTFGMRAHHGSLSAASSVAGARGGASASQHLQILHVRRQSGRPTSHHHHGRRRSSNAGIPASIQMLLGASSEHGLDIWAIQSLPAVWTLPNSPTRFSWSVLLLFLALYDVIATLFRVGFADDIVASSSAGGLTAWLVLEYIVCDAAFGVDIFFNAYYFAYVEKGDTVTSSAMIREHYKETSLYRDLIGFVPLDLLVFAVAAATTGIPSNLRLLALLRLNRPVRLVRLHSWIKEIEAFLGQALGIQLSTFFIHELMLLLGFAVLLHILACIWYAVGHATSADPLGSWTATNRFSGTMLHLDPLLPNMTGVDRKYLRSLYYATTSLTVSCGGGWGSGGER